MDALAMVAVATVTIGMIPSVIVDVMFYIDAWPKN
jgi:hypothetical protein